jgi:hypothetical protein
MLELDRQACALLQACRWSLPAKQIISPFGGAQDRTRTAMFFGIFRLLNGFLLTIFVFA